MAKKNLKQFFAFAFVLGFHFGLMAQDGDKELAKQVVEIADEIYFEQKAVVIANEQYVMAANMDPDNIKANYMAGKTYIESINRDRSAKYFLRAYEIDPEYRFDLLYYVGKGYQYGMEFDKALEYYNKYKEKIKKEKNYRGKDVVPVSEVERNIYECENGKEFTANPANFSIVNIGKKINSDLMDYGPVLNSDENILIFTSRRKDGNVNEDVADDNFSYEDIYISKKENGEWGKAENLGEQINTLYHESSLSLNADGSQLYIYRSENGGDIYISKLNEDGTYSESQPLSENINSSFSENSISESPDGQTLFFSSDRPGGLGGLDIYYSVKEKNGKWSRAKNVGAVINTEYDDDSPFIHYDGKTLYFSTKGRKGMGGYDIFKSEYDSVGQEWSEPVNLGYPINTPDNDVFFVSTKDGKRGYYASVREDGYGYNDIYEVTIPDLVDDDELLASKEADVEDEPEQPKEQEVKQVEEKPVLQPVTLLVRVEDDDTAETLNAKVSLTGVGDNIIIPVKRDDNNHFIFTVTYPEPKDFMLTAEMDGYLFKSYKITMPAATEKAKEVKRKIELNPLSVGVSSVLRNIYFEFDKDSFTQQSYTELNKLEKLLSSNPNVKVLIAGHTDRIGTIVYNKDLSQRRAEAVVKWLKKKGIDPRRLEAKGFGKTRPLASNDDESEGRELNRRVEFSVTSKK
ncbi:OmpA family protein [Fulvivirgaceae bacterium BMA12]|uniref:OmpA family protein n=1 Tax=Agaribacillus aureus TaxID=3051825 RepID=A0ABT8L3Z8_9BACT|nr:OmpA family protein [Fulvivirgaceae bacterium BMA12]